MSPRVPRIAVRALVVATAALAAALAALAFQPGSQTHYPDGDVTGSAGGVLIAALALATAAPGAVVWSRPRPWWLWAWSVIAVVTSSIAFAFMDDVAPRYADVVWFPARAVETGTWVLAGLATLGPLLAGFAVRAAEVTYDGEAPVLAAQLRRFILAIAALGVVLVGIGLLRGSEVYDDSNNCFGAALGALGNTESHHGTGCTPSYGQLRDTQLAGGLPLAIYVILLLAPAIVLYRDPRARRAWWWVAWSVAGLAAAASVAFLLEFHLDLFSRTRTLWPTRAVEAGMAAMQALLLVILPIMLLRARR